MLVPTRTLAIVVRATSSLPDPQTGHVEEHICLICQENLCSEALLIEHYENRAISVNFLSGVTFVFNSTGSWQNNDTCKS